MLVKWYDVYIDLKSCMCSFFVIVKDRSGPPSEQFKPDDTVEAHGTIATVVNEEYELVKGQNACIYLHTCKFSLSGIQCILYNLMQ